MTIKLAMILLGSLLIYGGWRDLSIQALIFGDNKTVKTSSNWRLGSQSGGTSTAANPSASPAANTPTNPGAAYGTPYPTSPGTTASTKTSGK
jgi:hypothetical protein